MKGKAGATHGGGREPGGKAPSGGPLYAIADAAVLSPRPLWQGVEEMAGAGVRWVQLRAKEMSDADFYRQVETCCRRLEGSSVVLWVNDRPDIATLFPDTVVGGVHLGQDDLSPEAARRVTGEGLWIGWSTHTLAQVREANANPAVDVVALGPIFTTRTKRRPDPVVGVEGLARAREVCDKPLVAIGGIDGKRLPQVLDAGADCAAVVRAVCEGDIQRNCRTLLASVAR